MTYTVKNGTWCKDNEKEYYSTTKTGLKAALKAGEIPAGTKVVVHEPKYHAGQLIQSMNPNCPEGCFVPDGSAFDTSIYTELAEVFPDGNLPDMRECVLVMVGKSEREEITSHDVYTVGEFKDDQIQNITGSVGNGYQIMGRGADGVEGEGAFANSERNAYSSAAPNLNTSSGATYSGQKIKFDASLVARVGESTHGKQIGVYYYIAF